MSRLDHYSAHTTLSMPLEFIDNNSTIDRAARRRIRSHMAMGRNAGKTLVRPSRKNLGQEIKNATGLIRIPKTIDDTCDSESNEYENNEIERQVGDGLSVLSIPKQRNPGSTGLVQKGMYCYPKETQNSITKYRCN